MVLAQCPICGKVYHIPDGRGRAMVETRFLNHKDTCKLPDEESFVRAGSRVGIVVEVMQRHRVFPKVTVQFPSGSMREYPASEISFLEDQDVARDRFYQ